MKNGLYLIGNAHISGNINGPRLYMHGGPSYLTLPTGGVAGTYGCVRILYDAASLSTPGVGFAKDRIVTGSVSGAKGRVLADSGPGSLLLEIIPTSVLGQVTGFRLNEVLTDNTAFITGGANKTATIAIATGLANQEFQIQSANQLLANGQITAFLTNPLLVNPIGGIGINTFWDRASRLAPLVTIGTVTGTGPGAWCAVSATGGGKATCCRVSGSQLALIDVVGNMTGTLSWTNLDASTGSAPVSVALTSTTAGNLVPLTQVPGLQGVAAGWLVPPGGTDPDGGALNGCLLGSVMPLATQFYRKFGTASRIYISESANHFGDTRGGMAYGRVPASGTLTPNNWTLGEPLTRTSGPGAGNGTWSATVQSVETTGLWLSGLTGSGTLVAGDVLTGGTSGQTITVADNVLGYMKGAKYWQGSLAGTDHTNFLAAVADTVQAELIGAYGWEGDLALPATSFVFGYTNMAQTVPVTSDTHQATTATLWAKWVDDVRAQLASPNASVVWFVHDLRSQLAFSSVGSYRLRQASFLLPTLRTGVRLAVADGFEPATIANNQTQPPTAGGIPYFIHLQTYDYVLMGLRVWDAYLQTTATVPSSVVQAAALIVELGQSQLNTVPLAWHLVEGDPKVTRAPVNPTGGFPRFNLLDATQWVWNWVTKAWETVNVASNLGGISPTLIGFSGPECAFMPRAKQRYGAAFLFKASYNGASSDYRARGIPCTFDVTPFTRATATGSITCTATGSNATFTGAAGTFSSLTALEWTEIAGSTGYIGSGVGNNTLPLVPVQITAVAANGSSVTVSGAGFVTKTAQTLTFTQGPVPLKTAIEAEWRTAHAALVTLLSRTPRVAYYVVDQGESNVDFASDYQARMGGVLDWMDQLFAPNLPNTAKVPLAMPLLSSNSPFGTPAQRSTIRTAQTALVNARGSSATIETSDLPVELGTAWPPVSTDPNDPSEAKGIHRTGRGAIITGERIDDALNTFLPARNLAVV